MSLRNDIPGSVVRVLGMHAAPRDDVFLGGGRQGLLAPVPLGTLANPRYTCHHLGGYLEFQDGFSIAVQNNGTKPHRYAALVLREPTVSPR